MKQLIFIDNDYENKSKEELERFIIPAFERYEINTQNIKIIPSFSKENFDKMCKLFFSGENVICSYSVYTVSYLTNSHSLQQLVMFLKTAGSNDVKNITYIDVSGCILKSLNNLRYSDFRKDLFYILLAIENNYIVTRDFDEHPAEFKRVRVNLQGKDIFFLEECDIKSYFN